jgi:hypothetical protein
LVNSIAARNVGLHDVVIDASAGGSLSSGASNLLTAPSGFAGGYRIADPRLGALSSRPGAPPTLPIGVASPAVDAAVNCQAASGSPVATDARGVIRPQFAACDLGAYEYDGDDPFSDGFD